MLPKFKKLAIAILLLITVVLVGGRYLHFGSRSSWVDDEMCFEIRRPHYPLRHWNWSGIFPVEGGFIPDPHFLCSEPTAMPNSVNPSLGGDARFQVVDVNQFFDDQSSEIELLIRSRGSLYEYRLQSPREKHTQAVIATPEVPAHIFPYKDKLALVAFFHGPGKGIYLIPLPLHSGHQLPLIPVTSPDFDRISQELKNAAQDMTVRDQFCESREWPFITYYEKYAWPCGNSADEHGGDTGSGRFDEFWRSTD